MVERFQAVSPGIALCAGGIGIAPREPVELWLIALWCGSSLDGTARELGLPNGPGLVAVKGETVSMAIAPGRWLIEAPPGTPPPIIESESGSVTGFGHGLSCFAVFGPDASRLMRKVAPIDLALPRHAPPCVVRTGSSHSTAFIMRREAADRFILYVDRSYGRDFLDFLTAEAAEFGVESPTVKASETARPPVNPFGTG